MKQIRYKNYFHFFSIILLLSLILIPFSVRGEEISDRNTIKIVQASLNANGFNCGSADGIVGEKTRSAIESFQTENGLEVTGIITQELLSELNITFQMLSGVVVEDFVYRYNEAVEYCNSISAETGDPKLSSIDSSLFETNYVKFDTGTEVSFLIDDKKISVSGMALLRNGNEYDMLMAYELVAITYSLDTSFSDLDSVVDFVGTFVENHSASTINKIYTIGNQGGTIFFAVLPIQ